MKSIQIGARTSVEPARITYLESDINYTLIHKSNGGRRTLSYTLGKIHAKLPAGFVRISRGCVVNLNFVQKHDAGRVWLRNGQSFIISRRRLDNVREGFEIFYKSYPGRKLQVLSQEEL